MNETKVPMTLCIVVRGEEILLGMKKRGFGAGRWNGFGGKLQEGESLVQAATREVKEEAGIDVTDLLEAGILEFRFEGESKCLEVHIFRTASFSGEPVETEEMKPKWFSVSEVPFEDMWPDDIYWLPLLLDNKKFRGQFLFDKPASPDQVSTILSSSLTEVESLD